MNYSTTPIILFDPNCRLCNQIKLLIELIDFESKLNFISIYDHQLYHCFNKINFWDCRKTIHIIDQNANLHSGENAVFFLINFFKITKPIRFITKNKLGKILVKQLYFLLNNYRINSLKNCPSCKL